MLKIEAVSKKFRAGFHEADIGGVDRLDEGVLITVFLCLVFGRVVAGTEKRS